MTSHTFADKQSNLAFKMNMKAQKLQLVKPLKKRNLNRFKNFIKSKHKKEIKLALQSPYRNKSQNDTRTASRRDLISAGDRDFTLSSLVLGNSYSGQSRKKDRSYLASTSLDLESTASRFTKPFGLHSTFSKTNLSMGTRTAHNDDRLQQTVFDNTFNDPRFWYFTNKM